LSSGIPIKVVYCGGDHVFVEDESSKFYCCGYNGSGELGLGDFQHRKNFTEFPFEGIRKFVCGGYLNFLLHSSDDWYCFGQNNDGQLGIPDNTKKNVPTKFLFQKKIVNVQCGIYYTYLFCEDKKWYCFGFHYSGEFGNGTYKIQSPFEIFAKSIKTIQIIASNEFKCEPKWPILKLILIAKKKKDWKFVSEIAN